MGVGFHPKQTSQLESNILCLAITQFRGVSVARFIPCCHVQMSHFPEGKKSEKSLSTLGFYIFLSGELIFFILCIYHKEIMSFVFIEKKTLGLCGVYVSHDLQVMLYDSRKTRCTVYFLTK